VGDPRRRRAKDIGPEHGPAFVADHLDARTAWQQWSSTPAEAALTAAIEDLVARDRQFKQLAFDAENGRTTPSFKPHEPVGALDFGKLHAAKTT